MINIPSFLEYLAETKKINPEYDSDGNLDYQTTSSIVRELNKAFKKYSLFWEYEPNSLNGGKNIFVSNPFSEDKSHVYYLEVSWDFVNPVNKLSFDVMDSLLGSKSEEYGELSSFREITGLLHSYKEGNLKKWNYENNIYWIENSGDLESYIKGEFEYEDGNLLITKSKVKKHNDSCEFTVKYKQTNTPIIYVPDFFNISFYDNKVKITDFFMGTFEASNEDELYEIISKYVALLNYWIGIVKKFLNSGFSFRSVEKFFSIKNDFTLELFFRDEIYFTITIDSTDEIVVDSEIEFKEASEKQLNLFFGDGFVDSIFDKTKKFLKIKK